jgi:hypothetical protein
MLHPGIEAIAVLPISARCLPGSADAARSIRRRRREVGLPAQPFLLIELQPDLRLLEA